MKLKLIFSVFFLLIFFTVNAQNKTQKVLEKYKDSIKNYGIVALVNYKDKIDTASVGNKNKEERISAKDLFNIGSCTKIFTANLILQLIDETKLNLNSKLKDFQFSKNFKNIDQEVTISNLLNHSSGIYDYLETPALMNASLKPPMKYFNDIDILKKIDSTVFEKNTKFQYSNSNYFILKMIIEEVEDKPFESVFQEKIIDRLNLKNTKPYYTNNIENFAHPMLGDYDLHPIPKSAYNKLTKGVGNITTNLYDLNIFLNNLFTKKSLLKESTFESMVSDGNEYFRLGLERKTTNDEKKLELLGHTGRGISYVTFAFHNIENDIYVIVIANSANDKYVEKIYRELIQIYLN